MLCCHLPLWKLKLAEAKRQEAWNETAVELDDASLLARDLSCLGYDFPDLANRAAQLLVQALDNRIDELKALKDAAETRAAGRSIGKWIIPWHRGGYGKSGGDAGVRAVRAFSY